MMDTYLAKTCEQCGAAAAPDDISCPYCGAPQGEFFKHPELVEYCRNSMLEMEKTIQEIPPAPGWRILLLWFGCPLLALAAGGLFLKGAVGWLVGAAAAAIFFLILIPQVEVMRQNLRRVQYEKLVRVKVAMLLRDELTLPEDLILLARHDEQLKKSALLKFLEADVSSRKPVSSWEG